MLADPSDGAAVAAYAQAAMQTGDAAGAITALERLLRQDPTLDAVRLELGLIYLALGNPGLAQANLEEALRAPDISPDARARAETGLAQARRADRRTTVSGVLSGGGRYDSNVNAGPGSPNVLLGGLDAVLSSDGVASDDYGLFGAAQLTVAHDLERQGPDRIELGARFYTLRHEDRNDFDLDVADFDLGPWLSLDGVGLADVAARVAGTYTYVRLEDQLYTTFVGARGEVRWLLSPDLWVEGDVLGRRQKFSNSVRRATATNQNGTEVTGGVRLGWQIGPDWAAQVHAQGSRLDAAADFESRDEAGAGLNLSWRPGWAPVAGPVHVTARVSWREVHYDAPDPAVDPARAREDSIVEAGLTLAVPVSGALAVQVAFEYRDNASNLANFDYDNTAGLVGLNWSF
ncbi:tetratricopeptide repeat protein [Zavarzinia sp. CC-PAN008]|uniref:tetratricopeptide repeat protein n=1 Tax=Zavarzinia sp. CC-PAN008 TaxID=3243332 RepID=UPI003F749BAB